MRSIKVVCERLCFVAALFSLIFNPSLVFAAEANTNLQVNVKDMMTVSITTPVTWARGNIDEFLRNKISISVETSNTSGFTASMYSKTTTNLKNLLDNTKTIPTLSSSSARSAFPANRWGYSLGEYTLDGVDQGTSYSLNSKTYGETDSGVSTSKYYPLISTSNSPIIIMNGATVAKTSGTQNIYFGAKANAAQASGTYSGTIVISVVTGTINNNTNPTTPTNPVTPNTDSNNSDSYATYTGTGSTVGGSNNGTTAYTRTSTDSTTGTNTTTTQVTEGNTTSQYPLGVTKSSIDTATIAAIGTSVATTAGIFFLIAARREGDDDEEEKH